MSALPERAISHNPEVSLQAFEDASIDPDLFDHEAHVYVAWLYLQECELDEALARFCAALKRLTIKLGIESKYHETITWFFMILIAERFTKPDSGDWQSFKRQNADLFATDPSIIKQHYSADRLGSALARTQFFLPDRLPL